MGAARGGNLGGEHRMKAVCAVLDLLGAELVPSALMDALDLPLGLDAALLGRWAENVANHLAHGYDADGCVQGVLGCDLQGGRRIDVHTSLGGVIGKSNGASPEPPQTAAWAI